MHEDELKRGTGNEAAFSELRTRASTLDPDIAAATFWRSAIWALACEYSENQCEMTHSEVEYEHGALRSVGLCIGFPPPKGLEGFADYLRPHLNSLGRELMPVRVYIGFNYGNDGLLTIEDGQVAFTAGKNILEVPEMQKLTYGRTKEERGAIEEWEQYVDEAVIALIGMDA